MEKNRKKNLHQPKTKRTLLKGTTTFTRAMRADSQDVDIELWQEWILEAIRKIRSQKQRPSTQRICQAIGSHHKFHEDIVAAKLEEAVANGAVIKLYNKGLHSYKAPVARKSVHVAKDSDVTRLVVKAVRELGEYDGSTAKKIETYVQKSNNIVLADGQLDFRLVIKNALRTAVAKEFLLQDGKLYKVGKLSLTSPRKRRSTSPRKKPGTTNVNIHRADDSIAGSSSISDKSNSTLFNKSADSTIQSASLNVSRDLCFVLLHNIHVCRLSPR